MRFSPLTFTALAAASLAILPSVLGTSFADSIDSTASHMSSLHASLNQLEAEARAAGHAEVVTHCTNARASLSTASSAWSSLGSSSSVRSNPSAAGSSPYASSVWSGLNSCGEHISNIGSTQGSGWSDGMTSAYNDCNNHYGDCQSGVTSVCGGSGGGGYTTPAYGNPTTTAQTYGPSQTAKGGNGHHGHHGHGGYGNSGNEGYGGYRARSAKRSVLSPVSCPGAETACKLSAASGSSFECVDTERELTSCGGCVSEGRGEDCTAIEGAAGVGCSAGSCVVFSCSSGYTLDADAGRCAPTLLRQGQSYH